MAAVVNATEDARTLDLSLDGFKPSRTGRCWKLIAPGLNAQNKVGKAPQVVIAENTFDASHKAIDVAPRGIELYEYRLV